jgi:hypothetical protein
MGTSLISSLESTSKTVICQIPQLSRKQYNVAFNEWPLELAAKVPNPTSLNASVTWGKSFPLPNGGSNSPSPIGSLQG